jgi:hypothetical protein
MGVLSNGLKKINITCGVCRKGLTQVVLLSKRYRKVSGQKFEECKR